MAVPGYYCTDTFAVGSTVGYADKPSDKTAVVDCSTGIRWPRNTCADLKREQSLVVIKYIRIEISEWGPVFGPDISGSFSKYTDKKLDFYT